MLRPLTLVGSGADEEPLCSQSSGEDAGVGCCHARSGTQGTVQLKWFERFATCCVAVARDDILPVPRAVPRDVPPALSAADGVRV